LRHLGILAHGQVVQARERLEASHGSLDVDDVFGG
jgi:hypothetical protein